MGLSTGESSTEITKLLKVWSSGDLAALGRLAERVYPELRIGFRRFGRLGCFLRRGDLLTLLSLGGRDVGVACGNTGLLHGFRHGNFAYGLGRFSLFSGRCRHFVISWRGDDRGHD